MKKQTTFTAKEADRQWYLVDANGKTLGRMASQIAMILRGKNKPTFSPHQDFGDYVVVINAEKVKLTGAKMTQKTYFEHTGFIGNERTVTVKEKLAKDPTYVVTEAILGMIPRNKLRPLIMQRLKVFAGGEHAHVAQQPKSLDL